MGNRITAAVLALAALVSIFFATTASAAEKRYNITTTGTGNWNISASWSGAGTPVGADDAALTNVLSAAGTRVVTGALAGTTINFLRVGNDVGGQGTNKLILQNTFTTSFGFIMSDRGVIEVWTNTMRIGTSSFITFDNRGTLALRTNALIILSSNNDKALRNAGTILFDNGGTAEFNYGDMASFTNNGWVVKNGAGTGTFYGEFGGNSRQFINNGTVQANAGVMRFDSQNAFSGGGFTNTSAGRIYIANNATVQVARTTAAWEGGAVNANAGTISLFGGSFLAMDVGVGQNNGRTNNNSGVISGFGTLGFSFINDAGTILATGGTLRVTGKIAGAGGAFQAGNATAGATLNFQGGAVGAGATITGNVTATNSSAIVFSGDSDWTLSSSAKYGFAGATTAERGSLISSNASGGSETLFLNNAGFRDNQGTLAMVGGNGINYGQIGAALTNNFVITGVGTLTGTFGASNNGLLNNSTISTVANSLLAIDPRDALTLGGFQNAAAGTVVIASGSTLSFRRTDAAWFTYGTSPTNFGLITMANASTMIASNTDIGTGQIDGGKFVNAAGGVITITGTNNITNFRVLQNNGLITINNHSALTNTVNSTGSFNNSGGVVELLSSGGTLGAAGLIVAGGRYVSDASSVISNSGASAVSLKFTANIAQTNAGTINIKIAGVGSGARAFDMVIGTASNTFLINTGTMVFETTGSGTSAKLFTISNQFVNAGHLILTNTVSGSAAGRVDLRFTGSTTGASTNEATGTIKFVENAVGGAASATPGTITFANGSFVNLGTISVELLNATTPSVTTFLLSQAGAVLSNAASGHIILDPASNTGSFTLGADSLVNSGWLVISNSGTINLRNRDLTITNNLHNSGTILFGGGNILAMQITNSATGLVSGNGTFAGSAIRLVYNEGTIRASGGTLFLAMVTNTTRAFVDAGAVLRVQDLDNSGVITSTVGELVVRGDANNSGIILLQSASGGTFDGFTANSGTIQLLTGSFGTFNSGRNTGTMDFNASAMRMTGLGVFTNTGTMNFLNSVGTFNSSVVNSGAWLTDPSTNVFQNTLTVTSSGYIQGLAGSEDVFIFTNNATTAASFINLSTRSNEWYTAESKFIFSSTLGTTQDFLVAGHDMGPSTLNPVPNATNSMYASPNPYYGFFTNFALGTLEIADFTTVRVSDAFLGTAGWGTNDSLTAGLYLYNLNMGLNSLLIISSNVQVYFYSSNNWGAANFILEGNPTYDNAYNGLHQLLAVPEPSVLMFLLLGGSAIAMRRKRNQPKV